MRLGQVMVFAKNMVRMRTFYRDVLGLGIVDESHDFVRYDAGGMLFALHALPAGIARTIEITDPPCRRSESAIKYTFHVDDVPAALAHLAAHGVTMSEPQTFGSMMFSDGVDPEGNVFQIANR